SGPGASQRRAFKRGRVRISAPAVLKSSGMWRSIFLRLAFAEVAAGEPAKAHARAAGRPIGLWIWRGNSEDKQGNWGFGGVSPKASAERTRAKGGLRVVECISPA